MPLTLKSWLTLLFVSLITASAQISFAQEALEDEGWEKLKEEIQLDEIATQEFKESLKVQDTVFNIPLLGNEKTDPETVSLTKETLSNILDQDKDGQADKPELTEFMANNDFKVIVAGSSKELDTIDDDDFPYETTAQITGKGISVDSYFIENLRVVAEAQVALLKRKAIVEDPESIAELKALKDAITQIKDNGLTIIGEDDEVDKGEDKDVDNDYDPSPEYILLSELVLSEQLATLIDRLDSAIRETLKKESSPAGKEYLKDSGNSIIPESYQNWKQVTPEILQEKAPLMCAWLSRSKLSAPVVALSERPLVAELTSEEKSIADAASVEETSGSGLSEESQAVSEQSLEKQPETQSL